LAGAAAAVVGGPIEIAGIAGRCLPVGLAPMSIERVTMTAGAGAAGAPLAAGLAGCAGETFPFDGVACTAGLRGCADFADGEEAFCDWVLGCWGAPGPRPSFGGRCIDGSSSAVLVDVASVSPLGLPEKSLEKTLIAEDRQ
jgi:hypothetical protein